MSRFEWAHVAAGSRLVGPDELDELAPEGNDAREYGVWCGDEVMLYGSLDDLRTFAERLIDRVDAAVDTVAEEDA